MKKLLLLALMYFSMSLSMDDYESDYELLMLPTDVDEEKIKIENEQELIRLKYDHIYFLRLYDIKQFKLDNPKKDEEEEAA